jgi:hypothetical protein
MSTQTHEGGDPPRLPLEMQRGYRTPEGMFVDELMVVSPGNDGYEQDYAYAVQCLRVEGEPMPYACGEDLAARGDEP